MEKRRAHYGLEAIKTQVTLKGADAFTLTALTNARLMGLSAAQAMDVVLSLTPSMFYKSMTTHFDATIWQDVYSRSHSSRSVCLYQAHAARWRSRDPAQGEIR